MLDWLTAIGTIAAAVVPFVLFLIERHGRLAAEALLRERELAVQEAQQAEYIDVLLDRNSVEPTVIMVNRSDKPVSNVELDLEHWVERDGDRSLQGHRYSLDRLDPTGPGAPLSKPLSDFAQLFTSDESISPSLMRARIDSFAAARDRGIRVARFVDAGGRKWALQLYPKRTLKRVEDGMSGRKSRGEGK